MKKKIKKEAPVGIETIDCQMKAQGDGGDKVTELFMWVFLSLVKLSSIQASSLFKGMVVRVHGGMA